MIDVFISHSSKNKRLATDIERALSEEGLKCWIAPRDVPPGGAYARTITDAISHSAILAVVLTPDANASEHVAREVELAVNKGIRVVPFRVGATKPQGSLEFLLGLTQWVQLPRGGEIEAVRAFAKAYRTAGPSVKVDSGPVHPPRRRMLAIAGGVIAATLVSIAVVIYAMTPAGPDAIASPADGGTVAQAETAVGSSLGLDDRVLVLVVRTEVAQRYYPQDPPVTTGWRGAWSAQVYFGGAADSGAVFELLLVETTARSPFDAYFETARTSGSWEGMEALPPDSKVLDRVRVTRR